MYLVEEGELKTRFRKLNIGSLVLFKLNFVLNNNKLPVCVCVYVCDCIVCDERMFLGS